MINQGALHLETGTWDGYDLIDCGDGKKLERFGDHLVIRSEPKAWWKRDKSVREWSSAIGTHDDKGIWKLRPKTERSWLLSYGDLTLEARLTDMSKHLGIFPEQSPHWEWISEVVSKMRRCRALNLFGYTGIATLVAASQGAEVTHVDASKPSVAWARRNQEISRLSEKPIRWILDDAFKFVQREVKRRREYDLILLDPPSFGRGPKGEIWKVESQLSELLYNLRKILNPEKGAVLLTMYNLEASSIMLSNLMQDIFPGGSASSGELGLQCSANSKILPLSLFCRWKKGIR